MGMNLSVTQRSLTNILVYLLGFLSLAVTGFLVYGLLAVYTEGILAPWDVLKDSYPLGTPQRTVNDFFEGPPGNFLLSQVTILAGAVLLSLRLSRRRTSRVIWDAVVANLIFVIGSLLLTWAGGLLDMGWRRLLPLPLATPGFNPWAITGLFVSWLSLLYLYASGINVLKKLLPRHTDSD